MVTSLACLVFIRAKSTRLPNKCYLTINGETPLTHIVTNLLSAGISSNDIYLATSSDKSCDELVSMARILDINVLRGSEDMPIKRLYTEKSKQVLSEYTHLLRICGDSPLYPAQFALTAFKYYQHKYSQAFAFVNTRLRNFPPGLSIEVYNQQKLNELIEYDMSMVALEHMTDLLNIADSRGYEIVDICAQLEWPIKLWGKYTLDESNDIDFISKSLQSKTQHALISYLSNIEFG
jgi:spore coat polysaccharide biosynthesis protein SpsF (cytidylyltransferase family)